MIRTVVGIAVRRLRHGKTELMLTFLVPVVFFSIFALIFGSGIGRNPRVRTLLIDADLTDLTETIIEGLETAPGLKSTIYNIDEYTGDDLAEEAARFVRDGQYSAVVFVPRGFTDSVRGDGQPPDIRILSDSSNQVAAQVVGAVVQKSVLTTIGEDLAKRAERKRAGRSLGALLDNNARRLEGTVPTMMEAAPVDVIDVLGDEKSNPLVAMSAAGIAVMFLLFSSAGSGGSLLEEEETGTLERLLASRLSMTQLLLGKWLFITLLGIAQVAVMFLWGHVVFHIDLFGHFPGFVVMTVVTSAAAASFALLLATACKSRTQLNGASTIIILTMSALGGSMVPRYVMSETMQEWGLVTFNAWALDGYDKVFWRDLPVSSLGPQVAVLTGTAALMFVAARVFARRWESF